VAFFDFKDLICTNSVPRGTTVNANYITEAVRRFMKILNEKRWRMEIIFSTFHLDNAAVHNTV
jgi:hypothetical protein